MPYHLVRHHIRCQAVHAFLDCGCSCWGMMHLDGPMFCFGAACVPWAIVFSYGCQWKVSVGSRGLLHLVHSGMGVDFWLLWLQMLMQAMHVLSGH